MRTVLLYIEVKYKTILWPWPMTQECRLESLMCPYCARRVLNISNGPIIYRKFPYKNQLLLFVLCCKTDWDRATRCTVPSTVLYVWWPKVAEASTLFYLLLSSPVFHLKRISCILRCWKFCWVDTSISISFLMLPVHLPVRTYWLYDDVTGQDRNRTPAFSFK